MLGGARNGWNTGVYGLIKVVIAIVGIVGLNVHGGSMILSHLRSVALEMALGGNWE
jgi:hypothetical protein